jgi:hypothetical protein
MIHVKNVLHIAMGNGRETKVALVKEINVNLSLYFEENVLITCIWWQSAQENMYLDLRKI